MADLTRTLIRALPQLWECEPQPVSVCIPCYVPSQKLHRTIWLIQHTIDLERCELIVNVEKQSVVLNRKACLSKATHDLICMVDDDVVLPPCWLSCLLGFYQQNQPCGAVGPRLTFPDGRPQNSMSKIGVGEAKIGSIPGTVMLYSRTRCDGCEWDEGYVGSQWEDTDFLMQIHSRGLVGVCLGALHVLHDNERQQGGGEIWKRNEARFREKWPQVQVPE